MAVQTISQLASISKESAMTDKEEHYPPSPSHKYDDFLLEYTLLGIFFATVTAVLTTILFFWPLSLFFVLWVWPLSTLATLLCGGIVLFKSRKRFTMRGPVLLAILSMGISLLSLPLFFYMMSSI